METITKKRGRRPQTAGGKDGRKGRIRALYLRAKPMRKSQMVETLIAEGHGTMADRELLARVVHNEASYMALDGLHPRWRPESR